MAIDAGKLGGGAVVACALAGVTRKTGVQVSAPAAAALARNARRDGSLHGRCAILARLHRLSSTRGSGTLKPHRQSGVTFREPSKRMLGPDLSLTIGTARRPGQCRRGQISVTCSSCVRGQSLLETVLFGLDQAAVADSGLREFLTWNLLLVLRRAE